MAAVLQNLFRQKMTKENFEVILVDDGSSDGTGEFLKTKAFLKEMNFKYIYFPREKNTDLEIIVLEPGWLEI